MSDAATYIDEVDDVEWVEIDCDEYERVVERISYRHDFTDHAPPSERAKLSVHISSTDSEGHHRSRTIWGNDTHGLVLWWSGYIGRYDADGRRATDCRHWVARHAMEVAS